MTNEYWNVDVAKGISAKTLDPTYSLKIESDLDSGKNGVRCTKESVG